tara:strand:+ start:3499 stop:4830 length:1332 start_codon:yes stop_codon:yes gene_type:complete
VSNLANPRQAVYHPGIALHPQAPTLNRHMDIASWSQLFREDPRAAATEYQSRLTRFDHSQQTTIWAWQDDGDIWDSTPPAGPLHGVPFAVKDLFALGGTRTGAGGILPTPVRNRDGCLVADLQKLGALPLAKTHLHEFAYGLTGQNPHFGDVAHPAFPDRTTGGSSSGSAAAVAAGIVPFALGSDTAGSLRVPAAYCGLYGWRDIPRNPWIKDAFPLSPQFDTAGWLTQSAADIRLLLESLRGPLQEPETTPRGCYLPAAALGVEADRETENLLETTAAAFTSDTLNAASELAQKCSGVGQTYAVLQSTEAYAIHQDSLDAHREKYGSAVWHRIDRGRHWTARQIDAAALRALKIRSSYENIFSQFDFLVTPITVEPAPLHDNHSDKTRDALIQLNTHVSIAGKPALAVPVPLASGLSLGLQVVFPSSTSSAIKWVLNRCLRD